MSSVPTSPFVTRDVPAPRGNDPVARLAHSSAVEALDATEGAILRYGLVALVLFFGAFLIKDIFLLGAALWSAAESLRAVRLRSPAP